MTDNHQPLLIYVLLLCLWSNGGLASQNNGCTTADDACLIHNVRVTASQIQEPQWRDTVYRELAKSQAAAGEPMAALPLINLIANPDTKAMAIRGIGMEIGGLNLPQGDQDALFSALRAKAEEITHPPSYGIALTYIAMSQAFAGNDAGARATAADMENQGLRNKAYGETAEIEAEYGDTAEAMISIAAIDDENYRNKAYKNVSKIMAQRGHYQPATNSALKITNPMMRAEALITVMQLRQAAAEASQEAQVTP